MHDKDIARMDLSRIWLMGLDSARVGRDEGVPQPRRKVVGI
jgi:hypothetical protein